MNEYPKKIVAHCIEDPIDRAEDERMERALKNCTCEDAYCHDFLGHYSDCPLYRKPFANWRAS